MERNKQNMQINFKALSKKYQTPYYIYDFDEITKNYKELKEAFKARKSLIAYAVKANSNLSVLKHLKNQGAGADCVSIGELKRALKVGIEPYKIIFSGVGKSDKELELALSFNILMINVESEAELKRLEILSKRQGKIARISIRVNPNIDAKTHPYISTGLNENKFGVDVDLAKRMYIYAKNSPFLEAIGIHCHIGSQLTELSPIIEAVQIVASLVKSLKSLKIDISFFDVGGGLGVRYKDEVLIKIYDYAQAILKSLYALDLTLICEPGRFLVANCGYFVTSVLYEKQNSNKRFVIVDGAMNDLIRPSLYNAYHKIQVLDKTKDISKCNVVGPICESGDFFAKDIELAQTKPQDLLIIHSAGAYGFSMSSNYNTRTRVAELAFFRGEARLIRRRESFEDLISHEEEFL